jgi:chromosome partitioning protein
MNVIAVFNQKGGVGKTTISVNLAVALASLDYKTVFIDMDFQGDGTRQLWPGDPPKLTVYDLLARNCCAEEAVVDTGFPNLSLIASSRKLSLIESGVDSAGGRQTELQENGFSRAHVDFVIIDCPPALGRLAANALIAANVLFIPVTPTAPAIEGMKRTLDIYRAVQGGLNPGLQDYRICLGMMDDDPLSHTLAAKLVLDHGQRLLSTVVPFDTEVNKAATYQTPAVFYNPNSGFARSLSALTADTVAALGVALPAHALDVMRERIGCRHKDLTARFKSLAERAADNVGPPALSATLAALPRPNGDARPNGSRFKTFVMGNIISAALGFLAGAGM